MITIAGLGISAILPDGVSARVQSAPFVCLRTMHHPAIASLSRTDFHAFDTLLTQHDGAVQIATQLLAYESDVLFLVPGHPRVADAIVAALVARAPHRCSILPAAHPVDNYADMLGIHAAAGNAQWCDAFAFIPAPDGRQAWADFHTDRPFVPATTPAPVRPHAEAWILNISTPVLFHHVLTHLHTTYRGAARCAVIRGNHTVEWTTIDTLHTPETYPCTLYLPAEAPLDNIRTADGISYIIERLLGPGGCHWDHEQTPQSLRRTLLEETYEAIDAIDRGDIHSLREELGDVLLNILMQAEMARQAGQFSLEDVYAQVATKFVRRHPHVFGDVAAANSEAVLDTWYKIKAREGDPTQAKSPLDGVPLTLPALAATAALINKSKRYGMAISEGSTSVSGAEQLGQHLFALAVFAAQHNLDAEAALREINTRYRSRVDHLFARDGHLNGQTQELWRDANRDA